MQYEKKLLEEKVKKLLEAITKWEESLSLKDIEAVRRYALEIESLGKDIMKTIWKDVFPGESISSVIERLKNNITELLS